MHSMHILCILCIFLHQTTQDCR